MRNFKNVAAIIFVLVTQFGCLFGQSNCDKWAFGADFDVLNPIKNLRNNGFGINYGVNFDAFYLGFDKNEFGFRPGLRIRGGVTESNSRDEFFEDPINQIGVRGIYNSDFDFKLLGRIVWNRFYRFQPYVEADMGIRLTGGNEQIQTIAEDEADALDYSENITKGISGSYGFGTGFLFRLTDRLDLNLRTNFDLTNLIKHVDFNTDFPFEVTQTTNAVNQRFAIGMHVHIGCEPAERSTKTKNRVRSNTRTKRRKLPKQKSSTKSRSTESLRTGSRNL